MIYAVNYNVIVHPMENLIRKHLTELQPYKPIKPPEILSEQVGVSRERLIKLDGNENPYGFSPQVKQALAECDSYNLYPDPFHRELRSKISEYTEINPEHIVVGSGSGELINLLLQLFLDPEDKVINLPPTFSLYDVNVRTCGGRVIEVPRGSDHEVDVKAVKSAIDERTKVILLSWPNNPTGNISPSVEGILELAECGPIVVVDEAYYEFSGFTLAPYVPQNSKLCVLRTFSKWAGLAGLRVGYGIFPKKLSQLLYQIKLPYNVNVAAQIAAIKSLEDLPYLKARVQEIVNERERLYQKLKRQGILAPLPSKANFLLCRVLKGEALQIKSKLRKRGIFIRHFDTPDLRDKLRITVGKPEHTDALLSALEEVVKEP